MVKSVCGHVRGGLRTRTRTYGQEEVNYIHEAKDDICRTSVAVNIGNGYQNTCDDMVGKHLSMILPARFNVDDQDLLDPKRQLNEVVPFESS